jgi:hypothetical protein
VIAENEKIQKVEYQLFSKALAPSDDKYYMSAYKVYFNLLWLNGEVGTGAGDVAGSGDAAPTDTAPALLAMIEQDLAKGEAGYRALVDREIPAFNQKLRQWGVEPLTTATPVYAEERAGDGEDGPADPD